MMSNSTKQLIKDISTNFAKADMAARGNDDATELKHLLYAIYDITVLLQGRLNDMIDHSTANTYSDSLKDSASRVNELIRSGVK